ncbi:hypothetical protein AcW1_005376 [Taiwanofungus camphoratus]|nr:hypothetical protein AcW2_004144 [Antrodia cinnamomea]KAI0933586.1 hypothetical protein AcV5_005694 [Antrodia cinnamomea]KAI0933587.1 hypothetical protein AcV5_005694 [Antrodia cinnamomea]KAI0956777.1 hypothetical protein AcW1_005376 [Antrodia cinnamomea]
MTGAWVQENLHSILCELANANLTLTAEMHSCGKDNVITLQRAAERLASESPPDAQTCIQLENLIELAHTEMRSYQGTPSANLSWRRLYTDACIIRALADVCSFQHTSIKAFAVSSISRLDHAIVIAGAPGEGRMDLILDLIRMVQTRCLGFKKAVHISVPSSLCPSNSPSLAISPLKTSSRSVLRLDNAPSLASFVSRHSQQPFILPGYVRNWPAMNEHPWVSLDYLRSIAGPGRVVPVEVGSDYRHDEWTQKMMPLDQFLDALDSTSPHKHSREQPVLYLAQHNLLSQFPALRDDIMPPDYVYASLSPPEDFPDYAPPANEDQLVLNAWLGPAGTVSPAHIDPFYNFYAQVVGRKTVWLAPPHVTPSMYPYPAVSHLDAGQPRNPAANNTNPSMSNTSRVDVFSPPGDCNRTEWPQFWENVVPRAMAVILEPGDLLFFPPGWWHAMRSEETSFSVSMWF